ncbi:hypothetical protein AAE478_005646 [Parahypoxylon ruwenzoriense]
MSETSDNVVKRLAVKSGVFWEASVETKVRAVLNLWFEPEFKPTFYNEQEWYSKEIYTWSGLDDIESLDPSYTSAVGEPGGQEGRYPVRMIDLDTGRPVDYPDIGVQGFGERTQWSGGLQGAKNRLAAALAARDHEKVKNKVFRQFLGNIGLEDDKVVKVIDDEAEDSPPRRSVIEVAKAEVLEREKMMQCEEAKIQFFDRYGHIREASAIKIEQAIARFKDIFNENPFPKPAKRYMWIDSCCINRANDGEHKISTPETGEWYRNAEFRLVHLDTPRGVPRD